MPYNITYENKGVWVGYSGSITEKTILEADNKLLGDKKFSKLEYLISDFSKIDKVDFNGFGLAATIYNSWSMANWNNCIKNALVVKASDEHYAKQWAKEVVKKGIKWKIKIFNNLSEARGWINSL